MALRLLLLGTIFVVTKASSGDVGLIRADLRGSKQSEHKEVFCISYTPEFNVLQVTYKDQPSSLLADYSGHDGCDNVYTNITGQVVAIARGNCTFTHKASIIQSRGGVAAIIVNYSNKTSLVPPGGNSTDYNSVNITVATILYRDFHDLLKLGRGVRVWLYSPPPPHTDPNIILMFGLATLCVMTGACLSAIHHHRRKQRRGSCDGKDEDEEDEDEKKTLSLGMGILMSVAMVVFFCVSLTLLYFFYDYLVYAIMAIFGLAGVNGLFQALVPLWQRLVPWDARVPVARVPCLARPPQVRSLLLLLVCSGFVAVWVVFRHERLNLVPEDPESVSQWKDPDVSQWKDPDVSQWKDPDVSQWKDPDVSQWKDPDVSQWKDPDVSQWKDPDVSQWKDPDVSQWKDPDVSQWKNPDVSQWKDPDVSQWKDPDVSQWKDPDVTQWKDPQSVTQWKDPDVTQWKDSQSVSQWKDPDVSQWKDPDVSQWKDPDVTQWKDPQSVTQWKDLDVTQWKDPQSVTQWKDPDVTQWKDPQSVTQWNNPDVTQWKDPDVTQWKDHIQYCDVSAISICMSCVVVFQQYVCHVSWCFSDIYAWILQDIIGFCFCLYVMRALLMPSLRACTVLLSLLFIYDIFFVFITPLFTKDGESVMIKVATGGNSKTGEQMPMVFKVPYFLPWAMSQCFTDKYSLLGYGDVIVPGLLLTYNCAFDLRTQHTSPGRWRLLYFTASSLAYMVGLILTGGALYIMKSGQPALLYLVPCTVLTTVVIAALRKELGHMWRGQQCPKKNDDLTAPVPTSGPTVARVDCQGDDDNNGEMTTERQSLIQ
ncbi:hypothetical protein ACOMHN_023127 [Nucella lapillus]